MKKISICLIFLCLYKLSSQDISKWDIKNILDIPIILSGTFAEHRSKHLHLGIDIKTKSKEGLKVYAMDSGYVYRLGVSTYGYGKFIEIMHNNGYKTLYAHLSRFREDISKYIRDYQYKKKAFRVELNLKGRHIFKINKGELIGFSGNTGSSSGPHVHFELRKKDKVINPMYLNFGIKDKLKPILKNIFVYSFHDNMVEKRVDRLKYGVVDTLVFCGKIGIGLETFDKFDYADNKNGVYLIQIKVNSDMIYEFRMDSMDIRKSKYVYKYLDYKMKQKNDLNVIKCFIKVIDDLNLSNSLNNGIIDLEKDSVYNVSISVNDFYGNRVISNMIIIGDSCMVDKSKVDYEDHNLISKAKNNYIENKYMKIFFPKNSFDEDINFEFSRVDGIYNIGKHWIYVNNNYKVTFKPQEIDHMLKNKLFLAHLDKDLNISSSKIGKMNKKDELEVWVSKLGKYAIMYDTIPPNINLLSSKNVLDDSVNYIDFEVKDDISGLKSVYGTLDDEWILLEREHKYDLYRYDITYPNIKSGYHVLNLVAVDLVGNKSEFRYTVYKK